MTAISKLSTCSFMPLSHTHTLEDFHFHKTTWYLKSIENKSRAPVLDLKQIICCTDSSVIDIKLQAGCSGASDDGSGGVGASMAATWPAAWRHTHSTHYFSSKYAMYFDFKISNNYLERAKTN